MDYPYVIFLTIILILALFEWRYPNSSSVFFKAATAVCFVFIGCRAPVIAGDMWNYTRDAMGMGSMYTDAEDTIEPLYVVYKSIFEHHCRHIFPFMLANTFIIFTPIWLVLKKYVKYKTVGILVFFLMTNYFMFLAAFRQCVALSLIIWGMMYVIDGKKKKYIVFFLFCFVAFFFHRSTAVFGIIFFGLYLLPIKNKIIPTVAIGVSLVIGVILRSFNIFKFFAFLVSSDLFLDTYNMRYLQDDDIITVEGTFGLVFRPLVVMAVFLLMDKERLNNWFCKLYLAGTVIYNMLFSMFEIQRVVFPFTLFAIVAVPFVLEGKLYISHKTRIYIKAFLFVVLLYFTRAYVKSQYEWKRTDAGRMHPYYFIWEDYRDHPAILY